MRLLGIGLLQQQFSDVEWSGMSIWAGLDSFLSKLAMDGGFIRQ